MNEWVEEQINNTFIIPPRLLSRHFFLFCSKTPPKLLNSLFATHVILFSLKFIPLRLSSLHITQMGLVNVFNHNFFFNLVLILSDQSSASYMMDVFLMLLFHTVSKFLRYYSAFLAFLLVKSFTTGCFLLIWFTNSSFFILIS